MNFFLITYLIPLLSFFIGSIHCRFIRLPESVRTKKRPDQELTKAEFQKIFHQSPNDELGYDFVNVTTEPTESKGKRKVVFTIDGKEYHLTLTPANSSQSVIPSGTPIRSANLGEDNQTYIEDEDITDNRFDSSSIYEDLENMATLLLHYEDGSPYYDGVFGEGKDMKAVRSLPGRLINIYGPGYHFIYNVNGSGTDVILNADKAVRPAYRHIGLHQFYPKLVVLVDYTLFKILNESIEEAVRYLAIFWNAVNLKFRQLDKPKINIVITGIIISKDERALKYVYNARNKTDMQRVNNSRILRYGRFFFGPHFYDASGFDNFDATFTMASLDDQAGKGGIAYKGGICTEKNNMAYVRDAGSYWGALIATHELGHLLNNEHDKDNCAEVIDENTNTIMARYGNRRVSKYVWSLCSLKTFEDFSKSMDSACLKDKTRKRQ